MNIDYYLAYDLPVPYKKLNLYPVTVKDYMMFNLYSGCLAIDKNSIPDIKIISMTYLEYLFYISETKAEEQPFVVLLDRMLSICLKEDTSFEKIEDSILRYRYDKESKKPFISIGGQDYTSKDFDEIKTIICQQNLIDIPDENISKEVRDSLEQARKYKQKMSGTKPASFEDYLISISCATGWTLDYLFSMTIRKFIKTVTRMDNLIHYKIYLTASMSGMLSDTSFIKHWLASLEEDDPYKDVSMDLDVIQDKVSLESAKK